MRIKLCSFAVKQVLLVLFFGCGWFEGVGQDLSRTVCSSTMVSSINFGSTPGTTYNWVNDNTNIGLAASGTGNITSFTGLNAGDSPEIANNPDLVIAPPPNQEVCGGTSTEPIIFDPLPDIVYRWTNSDTGLGLANSGEGNIPSFITNYHSSQTPRVSTITVTPFENGLPKTPFTFTITRRAAPPLVNRPLQPTFNNGELTTPVVLGLSNPAVGVVAKWTNRNPEVGLPLSGTGDIPSFMATNSGTSPIRAIITYWAETADGCRDGVGASQIAITINPTLVIVPPADQTVCDQHFFSAITFDKITGVTYSWTNDYPGIGLVASGTGDIPSFSGWNKNTKPAVGTITVTPIMNDIPQPTPFTFKLTVNPRPGAVFYDGTPPPDRATYTHSEMIPAINYRASTVVPDSEVRWTNSNPTIGLAANGTGIIPSFAALNNSKVPVTATVTANTYVSTGCVGYTPKSFTIVVNPMPDVDIPAPVTYCNQERTSEIIFSGNVDGTTYEWTNDNTGTGLVSKGSGNIPSFLTSNTGTTPQVSTITVTPSANGSIGSPVTFTITVSPTPVMNKPRNLTICTGTAVYHELSSVIPGTTYTWVNNNPDIIAIMEEPVDGHFLLVIEGKGAKDNDETATVTVTPHLNGCTGAPITFQILVLKRPSITSVDPTSQVVKNNDQTTKVTFVSDVTNTIFEWTNDNPNIGLPVSGNGEIPSFKAVNHGTTPVIAMIKVTPRLDIPASCQGDPKTVTIIVNPTPDVIQPDPVIVCNDENIADIIFKGNVTGTTFRWTNNTPNIGLGENGNGDIASFKAKNTTTVPIIATITVTPTANGADGTPVDFTITVNPTADVTKPVDQTLAHNETTAEIKFTSNVAGTTYEWINNNPAIGLAASGNGDLPVFTAVNTGIALEHATITVAPTANGCTGTPVTFTITVVPKPLDRPDLDQVVCGRSFTTAIVFDQVPETTYNWINNNTSIGLAGSGTGNIPSFQASDNRILVPIVATITVTPITNGVPLRSFVFTFTVNPTPGGVTSTAPYELTYTNNESTQIIDYTPTRPELPGAIVIWHNSHPDIGLPANGTGDIPSFITINKGTVPVRAIITATVKNDYCDRGSGLVKHITVNPTADVIQPVAVVACNNETVTDIIFRSNVTGTTFTWRNDTPGIGLVESGTDKITSFTAINSGIAPIIATITVLPTAYGTEGPPVTFTITVNPTADVIQPIDKILAHNEASIVSFSSNVAGTTYSWANNNPGIGLGSNGTGDINFTAVNAGIAPITAIITVTPTANGCTGTPVNFTITINPIADVIPPVDQTVCNEAMTTEVKFTSSVTGTTFRWTNNTPGIGLAVNGNGDIDTFKAVNTGSAPIVAIITVTPTANGADGIPVNFNIIVNPTTEVIKPADQIISNNQPVSDIDFTGTLPGTTFAWTNDTPSIGLAASGNGNIAEFTAKNNSYIPVTATITVTPDIMSGCTGIPVDFTITVNPTGDVIAPSPQFFCNDETTPEVVFSSNVAGTTYRWTNDNVNIGLSASGNGNIPSFSAINKGINTITANIVVIPTAHGHDGAPVTFTINIKPSLIIIPPAPQIAGNDCTFPDFHFESNVTSVSYVWSVDNRNIGLADNWSNKPFIPAFRAINTGTEPVTATVTVTPISTGEACGAGPFKFTITVNPDIVMGAITDQKICNAGSSVPVNFSSNLTGTTYSWTNDTPSIGLSPNGTGDIIPSFTATNNGTSPVVATITVTPTAFGCTGTPVSFKITINPTPDVIQPAPLTVNNNVVVPVMDFSSNVAGTTYNWTNDTPSIGLSDNGTGSLPAFTATNKGTAPVTANITVTPFSNDCAGTSVSFTITVNPTADVIQPINQTACNTSTVAETIFKSNVTGTAFSWSNNNTSIGLIANGTGDIASFTAINTGTKPVIATITVVPTANGAEGTPVDFTITVNPTADVIKPTDQTITHNETTAEIKFTSNVTGTTYTWSNDNTNIGLAATGIGNIAAFTAVNTGFSPVTATITVTPTANGCTGAPVSFTITVNPIPDVTKPADQTVSNNQTVAAVNFSGSISGTTFNWTNDNSSIGLNPSGTGNILSFTATNTSTTSVTATITVTPIANGVIGNPVNFTITVNPTADVIKPDDITISNTNTVAEIIFQSNVAGTTYKWTNDNTSIGLATSGTGNITSFTAVNKGTVPVIATITVVPIANGQQGPAVTFTITVNPTAVMMPPGDKTISHSQTMAEIIFNSDVAGTTYRWINDNTTIGLAGSGNGHITSFTAINNSTGPVKANVTVTPIAYGQDGIPETFTITVNPMADIVQPDNQTVCNAATVAETIFRSNVAGTTFSWTNDNPSIGLSPNGTGNIPSFAGLNQGKTPITAKITVTPSANGQNGKAITFTITVNPTADVIKPIDQTVTHNGTVAEIKFTSNVAGTTYSWTNDNTSIGLAESGNGDITAFTAVNTGSSPVTATIIITPTANGCTGTPLSFTITVNPMADIIPPADQTVCNEEMTTEVKFTGNVTGTTFRWINNTPGIGLIANGNGNIAAFKAVNAGKVPVIATITVIPTANGDDGTPVDFTITVNPTADVIKPTDQTITHNETTAEIKFTSNVTGTTYTWSNDNTSIGLATTGTGNIAAFTAVNTGFLPVTATITVTPTANGCTGVPVSFTITVNPIPDVTKPADQTVSNNQTVAAVNFSGSISGTTFNWTNDNSSIGLNPSGTGNIPSFTATNTSTTSVTATVTVTPIANGVIGNPVNFTITVNPTADVIKPDDITISNTNTVAEIIFQSNVAGTTYKWANDNTSIGLATSGTGNITSFTAVNKGTVPVIATITVVPIANGQQGPAVTFTITVNPTAVMMPPGDKTISHSQTMAEIIFNSDVAGTTYRWINDNTTIGLAGSGHGHITSFTAINNSTGPVKANVTVTPIAYGQDGIPETFIITVNPMADIVQPDNQTVCNAATAAETIFRSNVAGTTFSWTNDNPSIGLSPNGTGNIPSFTGLNQGKTPITAKITVTPSANGQNGKAITFTITVNPTADIIQPTDQTVCNNSLISAVHFNGNVTGTTFSWTNDNPSIGLSLNGTGDIPSFTGLNQGETPITAKISVTPTANGCPGIPVTFTITVNPTPDVIKPADQTLCSNSRVDDIIFQSNVAGTTYTWTNDNPAIGLNANGTGNIGSFKAINTGSSPITARIKVTPGSAGCSGIPVTFTLTVSPLLEVITGNLNICGPNGKTSLIEGIVNYDPNRFSYTFYGLNNTELTPSEVISITTTGDYKVKSKDKTYGCESELAIIIVGRVALPVVKINHPPATYAPFTIDLTKPAITTGSDPGLTFSYYHDAAGTRPVTNPEKVGGTAGDHTFYIIGQNTNTGCLSIPAEVNVKILAAPTLSISSDEIDEGEQVRLTIHLSDNAVLPENININLAGSVIKVPYQLPARIQLPAGTNSVIFTVTTQKSNIILKDQQVLKITGQQNYYQVVSGEVRINDILTDNKINPVILNISDGRIYEQGDAELTISLPGNLITDHDIEVSLSNGAGTTLNSLDYTYPAKVIILAGQHDVEFKLTATNTTGAVQKVVVDGKAAALGFSFRVHSGTVNIDAQRLIVGKVISDNGDGINDYFNIENINEYPDNEVIIFNRWGQEVYRAQGYNNNSVRFDSRINKGSGKGLKVPDGTYYYLITINKQGKRVQFKSFIKIKTQ